MRNPVTLRFVCAYDPSHGVREETFFSPDKRLLFPDGRRLSRQSVCRECRGMQADWEEKRDIEKFQWHEAARQRRLEQVEVSAERRQAREMRQRELDLVKMANLERQIDICTTALEALRKKYSPSDDKNT